MGSEKKVIESEKPERASFYETFRKENRLNEYDLLEIYLM